MPIIIPDPPEPDVAGYLYEQGTGLEVPGVEAVLEYGDASTYRNGGIPGALRINDRSMPDQVRVTELSGLHDDPDISDSRTERAGHWGERAGILMPRGRTIGVTGHVRAGNVARMRDLWRRLRSQFGRSEQDLIIHTPNEAPHYVNYASSGSLVNWNLAGTGGGTLSGFNTFTDGFLTGISATSTFASATAGSIQFLPISLSPMAPAWHGEDIWITALVKAQAAAATFTSIKLNVFFLYYDPLDIAATSASIVPLTGTGVVTSPTTGTYYLLSGRLSASTAQLPRANYAGPAIIGVTPATSGAYTLRAGRVGMVFLDPSESSPVSYFDGDTPGFEWGETPKQSKSYGPNYVVNQIADPDSARVASWVDESTAGTTVDSAGTIVQDWMDSSRSARSWIAHNSSTTSRTFSFRTPATLSDPNLFIVVEGRSYRVHARIKLDEAFASFVLQIVWLDKNNSTISVSSVMIFGPLASGAPSLTDELDGIVQAPSGSFRAYMRITSSIASTASGNRIAITIADPRFVDVTEYDVADAPLDSTQDPDHGLVTYQAARTGTAFTLTSTGARRRIPRPFVLRKARSLWDGKAPESQRNLLYRRDFTMSLRASDPRIYGLDERRSSFRASVAASLISIPTSAFGTALDQAPTIVSSDNWAGSVTPNDLGGRTAPLGGTWVTSGDATDLRFQHGSSITGDPNNNLIRTTVGPETNGRHAVLGTASYPDIQVDGRVLFSGTTAPTGGNFIEAIFTRWSSLSNFLQFGITTSAYPSGTSTASITQVVSGTPTPLSSGTFTAGHAIVYRLRLFVYSTGEIIGQVLSNAGVTILQVNAFSSAVATGGALASGSSGYRDQAIGTGGTPSRLYLDFDTKTIPNPRGPAPGFAYENASLDPKVVWRTRSMGSPFPLNGVGLGSSETPPTSGYLTQASVGRMYYSSGSTTYTTPQVTVSGNNTFGEGFDYNLFSDSYIGGTWHYNYIGALLKRVSSGTWIEARFNSANNALMSSYHASPVPPYSLELWSSHATDGTATPTRLAGWDIPESVVTNGERKHIRAFMDATNTVYVELWDFNGPNFSDIGLITRQSFSLSGPLTTLYGASVAGRPGMISYLGRWDDGTGSGIDVDLMKMNYDVPYLSTFESVDFSNAAFFIVCPVIGDVDDVPVTIKLRGDIDTPTIILTNHETGKVSRLMLSGIFSESDPVTIDMDAGTIKSDSGLDYFSRRITGSRFFSLEPGSNVMMIQAAGWNTSAPVHVIASWHDALR
jgi:hypothetical protein